MVMNNPYLTQLLFVLLGVVLGVVAMVLIGGLGCQESYTMTQAGDAVTMQMTRC